MPPDGSLTVQLSASGSVSTYSCCSLSHASEPSTRRCEQISSMISSGGVNPPHAAHPARTMTYPKRRIALPIIAVFSVGPDAPFSSTRIHRHHALHPHPRTPRARTYPPPPPYPKPHNYTITPLSTALA